MREKGFISSVTLIGVLLVDLFGKVLKKWLIIEEFMFS